MWVPLKTLQKTHSNELLKEKKQNKVKVYVNKTSQNSTQLDCRGMKLDQFEKLIESSLFELINGEIPFLEVLHGHGEGVLKKWLRTYLTKTHPNSIGKIKKAMMVLPSLTLKNKNVTLSLFQFSKV